MSKYRQRLPQLEGKLFLTDGGIETTLIFHDELDLPYFAAFHLLKDEAGRGALRRYFVRHASIARSHGVGFILESATWRASADWGQKLGYSPAQLADANRRAIRLLSILRDELETDTTPMVISGCVGPQGDGYDPGNLMDADQALDYHLEQISVFAGTVADMVTAITMTNVPEAIGVARAAAEAGMPSAISLTVETDGTLPTGQPLREAVEEIDAATNRAPAYYMINCAHPTHFNSVLDGGPWMRRMRGIRANASQCSHAELDEAEELDDGNPQELGRQYADLRQRFPQINVLGGCCGTDHRHIEQVSLACMGATQAQLERCA
jgi:S-methylmethionine-dependent homocysteine/selenocysteine methylase